MQITMPPKTKRQIAASLNYRKWKDREETRVRDEAMGSTSGEARVRDESTSGEAGVEGQLTSGEARVWGGSTKDEARVTDEQSTSEEDLRISAPWLLSHYRSGLITSREMTCAMLHYCCTQTSQESLACRRWTQLLLLPNCYRKVSVLL